MIADVAACIVDILIQHQIIEVQQASIYQYGFEILISSIITCVITLTLGFLFNCLIASLIYFGLFVILRSICGGYHAKTYWQCNLIYSFVTVLVLLLYKFMPISQFTKLHYCCILLSALITAVYAPVENENKPLSAKQKKFFRILGTAMVVLLALISCLLMIKFRNPYSIIIDTTLLVVAISMFVTDSSKGGEKNE